MLFFFVTFAPVICFLYLPVRRLECLLSSQIYVFISIFVYIFIRNFFVYYCFRLNFTVFQNLLKQNKKVSAHILPSFSRHRL